MPDPVSAPTATAFPAEALEFLRTPGRYAVVATIDPDGRPWQVLAWYRLDGTTVVLNSLVGRRWPTNLVRDPRVSITVSHDHDWVSVDGTVEIVEEQTTAQADIAAMARAYDPPAEAAESIVRFQGQRRVTFRVRPERVHAEIGE
ncbi:MAG TPA: TIGR03618 family F420-dependent PPOX class oxidoreductase [Candidatus Limnocylindrales bacterium]